MIFEQIFAPGLGLPGHFLKGSSHHHHTDFVRFFLIAAEPASYSFIHCIQRVAGCKALRQDAHADILGWQDRQACAPASSGSPRIERRRERHRQRTG